jgi:hypothetical protein
MVPSTSTIRRIVVLGTLLFVGCVSLVGIFMLREEDTSIAGIRPPSRPQSGVADEAGGMNDIVSTSPDDATSGAAQEAPSLPISAASIRSGGISWRKFVSERSNQQQHLDTSRAEILDNNARARLPVGSVNFLALPTVSPVAVPMFNVSLLYRTSLIREKPRHCFIVHQQQLADGEASSLNASTLASQMQLLASVSPERIPTIPLCHDDQVAALGDSVPSTGPHISYDVGFVFDGERCSTNMWHGLLEVVVPVFGAKTLVALRDLGHDISLIASNDDVPVRRSYLTKDLVDQVVARLFDDQRHARHVLLMKAPRKNIWGVHNLGCPILNHYPYGWSVSSVSGWLLSALFDVVTMDADGWPRAAQSTGKEKPDDPLHTLFFGETPPSNRKYDMRLYGLSRTVLIKDALFYGPSSLCRWAKAYEMPPKGSAPFYLFGDPLCPFVYDVTKKFTLLAANITEEPLTEASFECPRVGVVVRRSLHNGRGIRNFDELVSTLEAYVGSGGPLHTEASHEAGESSSIQRRLFRPGCGTVHVINLEADVPFGKQIRLVHSLDIVIGARGMGLTNAIFMKRGAGLLVLSGREIMANLNVANDNYPWHPLHALRPNNPAVLSSCPVVFPTPESMKRAIKEAAQNPNSTSQQEAATYAKRCVTRSVNFCDMKCDISKFLQDFDRLVFMMKAVLGEAPSYAPTLRDAVFIANKW